jgi:hypothetical protein
MDIRYGEWCKSSGEIKIPWKLALEEAGIPKLNIKFSQNIYDNERPGV